MWVSMDPILKITIGDCMSASDFMELREFLLLKDTTDYEPKRSLFLRGGQILSNQYSSAEDYVARYDAAKSSWETFGADGPPIGSLVEMLESGHGGIIGVIRRMQGIRDSDTRFFNVSKPDDDTSISLVCRETWFVSMRVYTEK